MSAREERRRLAYQWLRRGVSRAEVARRLGVSWAAVQKWELRRIAEGPNSWREHPHPGPTRRLTANQRRELVKILKEGAKAYGYSTDPWTLKRVAEVIRREWRVDYTLSGVWRVLRGLGLSAQVPLTIALERDEGYVRRWVRTTWPEIVERARMTRATLVFVDESGHQTTPNVRRSWAEEGSRPVLRCRATRDKVSAISGVTVDGELYFDLHENDMTETQVIWFLDRLLEEIPGRILVVWDNGGIHRAVEVQTFVWLNRQRLELRRFPPYAPELNPDEGIWDVVKNDKLANYYPDSLVELKVAVETQLDLLKRSPHRVMEAMRQSELDWEVAR